MLFITVTNWRYKAGVIIRLLLFLMLIALITPQFFNFVYGHVTGFKNRSLEDQAPVQKVEQRAPAIDKKPDQDQGELLLKSLQEYYLGKGKGKQAPSGS